MHFYVVGILALPFLQCATFAEAAAKPKPDQTLFGAVYQGKAYTAPTRTALLIGDLQEARVVARRWTLGFDEDGGNSPPRWRISPSGKSMMLDSPNLISSTKEFGLGCFYMYIYPTSKALDYKDRDYTSPPGPPQEHYVVIYFCPKAKQNALEGVFDSFSRHFLWKCEGKDEAFFFSHYEFFYDFVPLPGDGDDYTLFVLANGKLQQALDGHGREEAKKPLPRGATSRTLLPYPERAESDVFNDPMTPALGVWKHNKEESTKDMQWVLEETIPAPFNERFHAFVKGTTYFFLTDSGKVYMAKKPDKGERKLESLWDNDKYPVVAAIHDADADKVYLFSKAAKDDKIGTDFYWELDETVKRFDYEPSRVHPVKTVEPLKSVMELAQLLVDEKKIKLEKK